MGKLCAKMGTNVQALVNICATDIEVSVGKAKMVHVDFGKEKSGATLFFDLLVAKKYSSQSKS